MLVLLPKEMLKVVDIINSLSTFILHRQNDNKCDKTIDTL